MNERFASRLFARIFAILCFCAGLALSAEGGIPVNAGIMFNGLAPAGAFKAPNTAFDAQAKTQENKFSAGWGVQLNTSIPFGETFALRPNLGYQSFSGMNKVAGQPDAHLRQQSFYAGADLQLFWNGGAVSHEGSYVVVGVKCHFEKWDVGLGKNGPDSWQSYNLTRPTLNLGIGHSWRTDFGRFVAEIGYQHTLSKDNTTKVGVPGVNAAYVGFGWRF